MGAAKVGRNQACPCGSGRKFKQCCESRSEKMSLAMWIAAAGVAAVIVAGIVLGLQTFHTEAGTGVGPGVWSEEHGHYH
ncbi:MAG: SEC-C metal-binding domain-containing protein [Vicinamibacterales bacterium]